MKQNFSFLLAFASVASAWMPGDTKQIIAEDGTDLFNRSSVQLSKRGSVIGNELSAAANPTVPIRGVSVGSLFLFEPWIAWNTWQAMGCGAYKSELDCARGIGQDAINTAMKNHWSTYYTQDDFTQMAAVGINTIRIPVGFWLREDIVDRQTEPFPQGGLPYLARICNWAAQEGMYIVLELAGAPGSQMPMNPDTGAMAETAQFYTPENMERGLKFLEWIANAVHTNPSFRNVGMIEILNEPVQNNFALTQPMRQTFYPSAFKRVRAAEAKLGVPLTNQLTLQMMDAAWWSGDPVEYLPPGTNNYAYDDHRYVKWVYKQTQTKAAYMSVSCNDNRRSSTSSVSSGSQIPLLVGEWSLSAPLDEAQKNDPEWALQTNGPWYQGWFSAQARSYELSARGWIYYNWKAEGSDIRWSYRDAVAAGIIPKNLDSVYGIATAACNGFTG